MIIAALLEATLKKYEISQLSATVDVSAVKYCFNIVDAI